MEVLFLTYILRVSALTAVFCVLYNLFLREESFHSFNKKILFASGILSFILPLIALRMNYSFSSRSLELTGLSTIFSTESAYIGKRTLLSDLFILYIAGVAISLSFQAYSASSVYRKLKRGKVIRTIEIGGKKIKLYKVPSNLSFSWMNCIAIAEKDSDSEENLNYIIKHEAGHILNNHSCEKLLMNLAVALQWFNPFIHITRIYLCDIQEYQADRYALSELQSQTEIKKYKYLILSKAARSNIYPLGGSISGGSVKDRIPMMSTPAAHWYNKLKALYIPAVILIALHALADIMIME
ncbi:MAG: hypothetical protein E7108_04115 [Bacteroidales bacterium]|jgi:hypothetical protein|nr:hypothetical protein [Bacteroidales bacterium]